MSPLQSAVDAQATKISSLEAILIESHTKFQSLEKQISLVNGIILKQTLTLRYDELSKRVEIFEKHLRTNNLIITWCVSLTKRTLIM